MSGTYQAQGINLRHHSLGEADRIVSIFTREQGLIRVVAKGSKKTTSRLGGRIDLLQCNALQVASGRNLDVLTGAETIKSFSGLRSDYTRLTFALFLAEVLHGLLLERHPQPELYDLFAGTLAMLEVFDRPDLLALWFQLHALTDLGHRLGLDSCHVCAIAITEGARGMAFDLTMGALLCAQCRIGIGDARPINGAGVGLLQRLRRTGVEALASDDTDPALVLACQKLLGDYFSRLMEKELKSLKVLLTS